jgi:protoporphyrinogen oxidase
MLEIPCTVGDPVWSASDATIYERCMDDLERLGFANLRRATLDSFSTYVEEGYPIYHLDYQRDRKQLLSFVGDIENLISCGRQGAFRYIFMDTAMEMGIAAAQAVLARSSQSGHFGPAVSELGSDNGLVEAQALTA